MTKRHTGLKAGLGLAAVVAAAAGAYYFYGKNGAKNRKQLKSWMVKAKGEVMEQLERLSDVSQETYEDVVSKVMKKYKGLKHVAPKDWSELERDLKKHWKSIKGEVEKASRKIAKR